MTTTTTQTSSSQVLTLNRAIKHLAIFDFIMITLYAGYIFYHWYALDTNISLLTIMIATVLSTIMAGIAAYWIVNLEVDSVEDVAKSRHSDFTILSILSSVLLLVITYYIAHDFILMVKAGTGSKHITYVVAGMINIAFLAKGISRVGYVLYYRASENRTHITRDLVENIHSHKLKEEKKQEIDQDIYYQIAKRYANSADTIMIEGKERVKHPSRAVMEAYFKQSDKYDIPKNFSTFVAAYYDGYVGEGILGKQGTVYYYV